MPWKYNGERFIKDGNQWQDDEGVQHPWCWSRWDDEYKKSMGLVWHEVSKPIEVTTYDKFILQDGSDDLLLENNDKFILQDGDDLLLEDGDNLLSENGSENLLLESIAIKLDNDKFILQDGDDLLLEDGVGHMIIFR
tara:strand:- start:78 stop:488 length:411 start_codon:yes stop_codon:yes gene_type:complete